MSKTESEMELERKFLIKEIPGDVLNFPNTEIVQAYLGLPGKKVAMRVRQYGEDLFFTIKASREEGEEELEPRITKEMFNDILEICSGIKICKLRVKIPFGKVTIELDFFRNELRGLVLGEVEFETVEDKKTFIPPDWFGQEVTDDPRFKNVVLSREGIPKGTALHKVDAII
ncbi:adenylate cyclase [Candidatus Parcubacteria bacterium]|nr:MAG: adenylate cyclase [Candidatus Parcubacteria bacterium]